MSGQGRKYGHSSHVRHMADNFSWIKLALVKYHRGIICGGVFCGMCGLLPVYWRWKSKQKATERGMMLPKNVETTHKNKRMTCSQKTGGTLEKGE